MYKKIIITATALLILILVSNWSLIFNPKYKMYQLLMKSDNHTIYSEWQIDYLVFRNVDLEYKPYNDISLLQLAISKCNLELLNKINPITTKEQKLIAINYAEEIYDNFQCPKYAQNVRNIFGNNNAL